MNVVADSAVSSLPAQRIEQGIRRGTRGGGDYCAVMLIGAKLVDWIGRKSNLDFLTASTRVQLATGQEMSAAVTTANEVGQTIMKMLQPRPGLGRLSRFRTHRSGAPGADQYAGAQDCRRGAKGVQVAAARSFEQALQLLQVKLTVPELHSSSDG
jgi:hypothetical protein